jgi:predicted phage terminase large subunit-like protein
MTDDARAHESDDTPPLVSLSVRDAIPRIFPGHLPPDHMPDLVEALDGVIGGEIRDGRFVVECPIRHGKSETIMGAAVLGLMKRPRLQIGYITYGAQFSETHSRKMRRLYQSQDGRLSPDFNTLKHWETPEGGFLHATGIDGDITGRGFDVLLIDDPIKDREDAMSPIVRDIAGNYIDEAIGRLNVGGSVFLVAARFHTDDPSGRMLTRGGWRAVHYPAIIGEQYDKHGKYVEHNGERALWPAVRPLDHLRGRRFELCKTPSGEYLWLANYQNTPRVVGGSLFRAAPTYYTARPNGLRISIGVDLAYSEGKKSDSAAIVVLGELAGFVYVLDVQTFKLEIGALREKLREAMNAWPGAPAYSYVSGPERGTIVLLATEGVPVYPLPARFNKAVRAQKSADAWNESRIMVPAGAPWVPEFVKVVQAFTGTPVDDRDDEIDALASGFDMLQGSASVNPRTLGGRRM